MKHYLWSLFPVEIIFRFTLSALNYLRAVLPRGQRGRRPSTWVFPRLEGHGPPCLPPAELTAELVLRTDSEAAIPPHCNRIQRKVARNAKDRAG